MKLIGLMVCRNGSWVLGCSLRVALRWCDEVVILDHGSSDDTPDIISDVCREHPGRVHTIRVRATDGWLEQTHRQMVFQRARDLGGTHFAIIDDDEVPTGHLLANHGDALRALLENHAPVGWMAALREIPMWGSLDTWRTDGAFHPRHGRQIILGFADAPNLHWAPREDGYHLHARYPMFSAGIHNPCPDELGLGVMHLQFVERRRLEAKNWWYRMVERIQHPTKRPVEETNRIYGWVFEGTPEIQDAPPHWWGDVPERRHIRLGQKPWHEDEIERLFALHGTDPFHGLYLGPYTERLAA